MFGFDLLFSAKLIKVINGRELIFC